MSEQHIAERFMRYVQIDTEADPNSDTTPSSMKQMALGALLVDELQQMGISEVEMDDWGYVYATIPATSSKNVPVLCFCSHMDTAPDCSGANVRPQLIQKWDGSPILLPDDPINYVSSENHPYLLERIGDDIITAGGNTLLGADDKAGIAIIMDLTQYLLAHPEIKHGKIRILFTPDEEIGRGVDKVDMQKLNADFGYTLDGGERGTIEDENFSADSMTFQIRGISAHPGYAKGKMVHACKILAKFIDALPINSWCPEATANREGFVHIVAMNGGLEDASVTFIIRDHETAKLAEYEDRLKSILDEVLTHFEGGSYISEVKQQYRNMKEILKDVPQVCDYAIEAMKRAGVEAKRSYIRGGTDGSRLSFMGMPCPNLFTGEMGIHSKQEYVSVQDMEKAVDTLVALVQIWEEKS